jgi:hypothetical protein
MNAYLMVVVLPTVLLWTALGFYVVQRMTPRRLKMTVILLGFASLNFELDGQASPSVPSPQQASRREGETV